MSDAVGECAPFETNTHRSSQVAANGDTANKIGTYQIACVARHHGVPFYVAAPLTSIDLAIPCGDHIVIEERPDREMTHVGEHRIAAPGIACWNPAFDVTPADLITGIITERGCFVPAELQRRVAEVTAAAAAGRTAEPAAAAAAEES